MWQTTKKEKSPGYDGTHLNCIKEEKGPLLVGALLRTPDEMIQHAGMCFDLHHTPYHAAEGMVSAVEALEDSNPFEVPGVTAALMLVERKIFQKQPFDESYTRCGEDVQLNLDLRRDMQGRAFLCPGMSGIHAESATRSENDEWGNASEDLVKMRTNRRLFLEQAAASQLRVELDMAAREHAFTKYVIAKSQNDLQQQKKVLEQKRKELERDAEIKRLQSELKQLQRDRDHWERQAQILQLQSFRDQDASERRGEAES